MKKYIEQINKFIPTCIQEEKDKALILEMIEKEKDNILIRETKYAHLTSSGLVVNKDLKLKANCNCLLNYYLFN